MLLGFGVIILFMMFGHGYMLYELYNISSTARGTLSSDVRAIDLAKKLQSLLNDQELSARKYLVSHDPLYIRLLKESGQQFDEEVALLLRANPARPESDIIDQLELHHERFMSIIAAKEQARTPAVWRRDDEATKKISGHLDAIRVSLDEHIKRSQLAISASMTKAEVITSSSSRLAFLFTGGSLLVAVLLAVVIARTITQPIEVLIRGTDRIAHGSFEEIRVGSNDEIASLATAFNDMIGKLGELNEARAELTHQILHELQTPLTAILGSAHVLHGQRTGTLNAEQLNMVVLIDENANKLRDFSHQLLDIAKMEAGMISYDFVRTDIRPIVDLVLRSARTGAMRKNITIESRIDPLPEIRIDLQKFSVILNNLLSNAIKYTPANGKVAIEAAQRGDSVEIQVRDTGIGIPEGDLPRLFTKFFRASNASLSGSKGTGIGLALVKAFAEGHGGDVTVTSTLGQGSTFVVALPTNHYDETALPSTA
jgi:two-component system sensor histidine kinase GlrK